MRDAIQTLVEKDESPYSELLALVACVYEERLEDQADQLNLLELRVDEQIRELEKEEPEASHTTEETKEAASPPTKAQESSF